MHHETGREVAVKQLPKQRGKLTREKTLEKLAREVDLLSRLQDCARVIHLEELYEDENEVYLVTELCQGGDLQHYSERYGPLKERCLAQIALEVLLVIQACHERSVVLGDVKPANFCLLEEHLHPLCCADSVLRKRTWLKAIDFGCSQSHKAGAPRLSKRSGTPVYMAPETFLRSYSYEVDMWSLGVMLYQLFSRRLPFWEGDSYSKALSLDEVARAVSGAPMLFDYGPWRHMSPDGMAFLRACLERHPQDRLTVAAALQHPWLLHHTHAADLTQHQQQQELLAHSGVFGGHSEGEGAPGGGGCGSVAVGAAMVAAHMGAGNNIAPFGQRRDAPAASAAA